MMSAHLLAYETDQNNSLGWPHPPSFSVAPQIRRFWVCEPDPAYGPLMQRLGRSIRSHRKAAGHSQESFADKIGMHRAYYSAIERGEKNLQIDTLQRVCDGLKVRMSDVLKDADE